MVEFITQLPASGVIGVDFSEVTDIEAIEEIFDGAFFKERMLCTCLGQTPHVHDLRYYNKFVFFEKHEIVD